MQVARDENRTPAIMGVLNTDGITPQSVYVNATNHRMKCADGTTGSDLGNNQTVRDENRVTSLMAVSSADGMTPVTVYIDNLHNLLIKST